MKWVVKAGGTDGGADAEASVDVRTIRVTPAIFEREGSHGVSRFEVADGERELKVTLHSGFQVWTFMDPATGLEQHHAVESMEMTAGAPLVKEISFGLCGARPNEVFEGSVSQWLPEGVRVAEASEKKLPMVLAPMTGRVLKDLVAVGDAVIKGQPLLSIEAMKMENTISAPQDGVIKEKSYHVGETVKVKQPLLVLAH